MTGRFLYAQGAACQDRLHCTCEKHCTRIFSQSTGPYLIACNNNHCHIYNISQSSGYSAAFIQENTMVTRLQRKHTLVANVPKYPHRSMTDVSKSS